MSWWDFGASPDARRRGSRRTRRLWLAAVGGALACAAIAGFAFWQVTAAPTVTGPSWAPQPRTIGGLHAVAAAGRAEYSLYTAHGAVHFLPGVDLGATTPGHQPGELAITPRDYRRWLYEMGELGVRAVRAIRSAFASVSQAPARWAVSPAGRGQAQRPAGAARAAGG